MTAVSNNAAAAAVGVKCSNIDENQNVSRVVTPPAAQAPEVLEATPLAPSPPAAEEPSQAAEATQTEQAAPSPSAAPSAQAPQVPQAAPSAHVPQAPQVPFSVPAALDRPDDLSLNDCLLYGSDSAKIRSELEHARFEALNNFDLSVSVRQLLAESQPHMPKPADTGRMQGIQDNFVCPLLPGERIAHKHTKGLFTIIHATTRNPADQDEWQDFVRDGVGRKVQVGPGKVIIPFFLEDGNNLYRIDSNATASLHAGSNFLQCIKHTAAKLGHEVHRQMKDGNFVMYFALFWKNSPNWGSDSAGTQVMENKRESAASPDGWVGMISMKDPNRSSGFKLKYTPVPLPASFVGCVPGSAFSTPVPPAVVMQQCKNRCKSPPCRSTSPRPDSAGVPPTHGLPTQHGHGSTTVWNNEAPTAFQPQIVQPATATPHTIIQPLFTQQVSANNAVSIPKTIQQGQSIKLADQAMSTAPAAVLPPLARSLPKKISQNENAQWYDACIIYLPTNARTEDLLWHAAHFIKNNCQACRRGIPVLSRLASRNNTKYCTGIRSLQCECSRGKAIARVVMCTKRNQYVLQLNAKGSKHACGNPVSLKATEPPLREHTG
jgi:hypothetical protein